MLYNIVMRIIAGKHKGRILSTFEADNIRPTSDRVKEAIFSKIQFVLPDSTVLDLFGGTGNFGLEALSRGAKLVYICDNNDKSINLITKNNNALKENAKIIKNDFHKILKNLEGVKFDIIFLDPPYATNYGEQSLELINKHNLLSFDGFVIFEHNKGKQFDFFGFELFDQKTYGTMQVSFLKVKND